MKQNMKFNSVTYRLIKKTMFSVYKDSHLYPQTCPAVRNLFHT